MTRFFPACVVRDKNNRERGSKLRPRVEPLEDRRLLAMGDLLYTLANPSTAFQAIPHFGSSVAADDQYTVVGTAVDDLNGHRCAGNAYVYNTKSGALVTTIENPTRDKDAPFGTLVAVSGNTIVVGVPRDGTAYVFDAPTGNLLHTLPNPAPPHDKGLFPVAGNMFGWSVAASGNTIVVGAPWDGADVAHSGSVYLFDATTGNLLRTLVNPAPGEYDHFGDSVAVSGNNVVVGASWNHETGGYYAGAAYVFEAATGNLLFSLPDPTPAALGYFGSSVAISGNTIVVGAPCDDTAGMCSGSAYVFDASTGSLLHTFTNPTPNMGDYFDGSVLFANSVAVSDNTIVVGAKYHGRGERRPGEAYVFDAATGHLLGSLVNPTPAAYDYFGCSVAVAGQTALVGAPGDDGSTVDEGALYVFDITHPSNSKPAGTPFAAVSGASSLHNNDDPAGCPKTNDRNAMAMAIANFELFVESNAHPLANPVLVTADDLDPIVGEAKRRMAQGYGQQLVRAALSDASIETTDLPGRQLGQTIGRVIRIDRDAAGRGWFIDRTKHDDDEFGLIVSESSRAALAGTMADGRVDLLTAVMQEMGHLIGFVDLEASADSLMADRRVV